MLLCKEQYKLGSSICIYLYILFTLSISIFRIYYQVHATVLWKCMAYFELPSECSVSKWCFFKPQKGALDKYNVYLFISSSIEDLTLKGPGFLDPSHSRGGADSAPQDLGNRLTKHQVCGTSGLLWPSRVHWFQKVQTYLVWRHSDIISDVMSKTRKSPKIAKIMVFRYFFNQKLHFLAMMCVKVCLHMFLLQINQINKWKHSKSVSWKQKNTICV